MKTLNSIPALFTIMAMLLFSIILLSIWGYHNYFAGNKPTSGQPVVISDSSENAVQQKPITQSPKGGESPGQSDVTTALLKEKLGELELLKAEITAILAKSKDTAKAGDSLVSPEVEQMKPDSARPESDINGILDSLKVQNEKIVSESKQLTRAIHKVKKDLNKNMQENDSTSGKKKVTIRKPTVLISNLDLYALKKDRTTTSRAEEADFFYGSFVLNSKEDINGSLFIRITKPDGKIIVASEKVFDTPGSKNDKIPYSLKVSFTNYRQRVSFNLPISHLSKGVYSLEVYYKGSVVARSAKTMS